MSACIVLPPTGWTSVKFVIEDFKATLLRKAIFGSNHANIFGTLHEDLSTFFIFLFLPVSLNHRKDAV
jgi:hypothetical protein